MTTIASTASVIPLALTVCDTRARSTQKGRVLHREVSAIRLSGEHDRHQAGRPKWRNQPSERQRRRTIRRVVRPVRAGSARRRPGRFHPGVRSHLAAACVQHEAAAKALGVEHDQLTNDGHGEG